MRSNETIIETLQSAFLPLKCVVELHDFDHFIGFRVYSPAHDPIITFEDQPVTNLLSGPALGTIILSVRDKLKNKGFDIYPRDAV